MMVVSASFMSGSDFPRTFNNVSLPAGEANIGVTSTNNLPPAFYTWVPASLTGKKIIPMVSWHRSSFVDDRQIHTRDFPDHSLQGSGYKVVMGRLWTI